ncbi:hypothetical protein WG922_07685 [Ramlibacter sp. AN1015]|uniref:hypothetical protein n=1 Tax=Ramlibacter sp. AN1015 TaxID=3133428 RepID=UPI0030C639FF
MDAAAQAKIVATLTRIGKTMTVLRNGVKVGATKGVELSSEQTDDSNSLLAQTAQTRKTLIVFPVKQAFVVGDTVVMEKQTFTITKVDAFRPAAYTLYVKLEVI